MARLLLLTNALAPSAEVLPALGLLSHTVRILPAEATALVDSPDCDVVLVDARRELASARSLCRVLRTTGIGTPLLAVLTEGGLAGLTAEWGLDDVLLDTAASTTAPTVVGAASASSCASTPAAARAAAQ